MVCGTYKVIGMRRTAVALILAILSSVALADDFVGQASVIDGDTLEMHGVRIRLWGIDAPESSQLCRGEDSLQYRCGAQAANDLDAFIARRPVNCVPVSLDPYGRTVATCSVAGRDLGEWRLCATALRWIGLNTRRANIAKLSARLSAPARDSGRAATSSHGSIVHASAQAESRPPVRTMQMPILE
ncbi:endonuclease YncB(thermonuclease family) [Bradyrhizobium sp. i1.4.4]